ncbi:unnamed protein product, partial [Polarella glacialis]
EAVSLLVLRIGTGRKHQIRAHTAHIGHQTICDGRYSSAATFHADGLWCARNFLHRYRLAFRDACRNPRQVVDKLPADLCAALAQVRSRGSSGQSEASLRLWLEEEQLLGWDELPGLTS